MAQDAKPPAATVPDEEAASRPLFKRMLVIVTGIRGYEEVVREAGELASAFGAEVIALYVLDQNKVRQLSRFSSKSIEAVEADLEEDGWTYLYYTEQQLLELELEQFVSLRGEQKTLDRIQHMLMKGKPLRN